MKMPATGKRSGRASLAQETLEILEKGSYDNSLGQEVNISPSLASCLSKTRFYLPEDLETIRENVLKTERKYESTSFEVYNESSLVGAEILAKLEGEPKVGVLNFASAKNPGGGFLGGSQAQEEALARSSGLYLSLQKAFPYYEFHRSFKSCAYSDRMIYSPHCPVIRVDEGDLIEKPYHVDFLTSPAPNKGAMEQKRDKDVKRVEEIMEERASKLLGLFAHNSCEHLVLGAWGCGVFRNDPIMVADVFYRLLGPSGVYWGRFQSVRFSVLDRAKKQENIRIFEGRFGK